ncbi:hypothetical protein [Nocardioides sp. Root140]|uniref:hypothetical protein n=1 Tax=Nocardioides sp. Root140 TaxID=1736460 RepID=UPI0006F6D617|nr:hypothetical protein [Nocardioides sp. Root140]KQY57514.1 hypothetical protein ASD30_15115 [Nocardioides sp. Root140]
MQIKRLAAVAASLTLLGGLTAACGGSPDDASKDDFCEAMEKVNSSTGDDFDKAKDAVKDLADVGTPDGIPDDARDGFELLVDAYDDADSEKDLEGAIDDLGKDDEKKGRAFGEYYAEKCVGDLPTGLPSDLPSDIPSDLPSELPSGLPSELPSGLPSEIPSDLLSNLPSDFPSSLLTMLPSDMATE